jgi:uroporphyrin-III C-methyltransferase/precorrin-2 dehydrogenase/sirohydrochlorin ferrochelatase
MQALATLPVFFKLSGQRAVVAGGSAPALWKAELLASAGAQVEVYADAFADGFEALASDPPNGSVRLIRNSWKPADLNGAAIAIGACADDEDAAAFASAARSAGVPVNVIDRPAFCDFQFGAIVNRSPLVMAISTDGGAPVFAQAIRSLVEALLPDTFKRWAEAAKAWRDKGDELGETPAAKRRFWERFAEMAMREGRRRPPSEDDLGELLREPSRASHAVAIIDIGENVESLTLGALRLLRSADLIVFDSGVPAAILDFARREARRLEVPPGANEVADELVAAARNGDRVVCLLATFAAGPNVDLGKALTEAGASVLMLSSGSIVSE